MLRKLKICFNSESEKRLGYFTASLLQGVLMQQIDAGYAEKMHQTGLHPYSQFALRIKDGLEWHIHTLNEEAGQQIIDRILLWNPNTVHLDHKDADLHVVSMEASVDSYDDLMNRYFFENQDRFIKMRFLTPTSFKQNGQYCLFPDVRLIMQSLMNRYDACSPDSRIVSDELLRDMETYCHITGYRLRSVGFAMESIRIPSFLGEIRIRCDGPQQMINLVRMLVEFGTYSGVGIKTGMGMGALEIVE